MVSCTIVIPTHNREDLLPRAVRSALAACPADGEVLVVDDKSIVAAEAVLGGVREQRLRVLVNSGPSGAAHSRNLGVREARGDVMFFLDDDDELMPGYCIRTLADAVKAGAGWGFSSTIERRGDADAPRVRRRLQRGLVPLSARPRDVVAAMSDGFWIQRGLFLEVGGLDTEQAIDEDTDLCVRLLSRSLRPWYEPDPGMVVYRGYVPARAAGAQLTVATSGSKGVRCYRRSHDKNVAAFGPYSAMRWFLATRYLRRAAKAGVVDEVKAFVREQRPWLVSIALMAYVHAKLFKHRRP